MQLDAALADQSEAHASLPETPGFGVGPSSAPAPSTNPKGSNASDKQRIAAQPADEAPADDELDDLQVDDELDDDAGTGDDEETDGDDAAAYSAAVLAALGGTATPGRGAPAAPATPAPNAAAPTSQQGAPAAITIDDAKFKKAIEDMDPDTAGYITELHTAVKSMSEQLKAITSLQSGLKELEGLKGLGQYQRDIAEFATERQESWRNDVHAGLDELAKMGFSKIVGKDRAHREQNAQQLQDLVGKILNGAEAVKAVAQQAGKKLSMKDAIVKAFAAIAPGAAQPEQLRLYHQAQKARNATAQPTSRPANRRGSVAISRSRDESIAKLQQGIDAINGRR
jgi:hypothetical protein